MAIYMKYGSVEGPVTTKGFEKWIEVTDCTWNVLRAVETAARGSTNREKSEPQISEIHVLKKIDTSSTKLFTDAVAGQLNSTVTIKFTTTTKDTVVDYMTLELSNAGLSGYQVMDDRESLQINFTKIMMTYKGLDPSISGNPDTVGYDMTQMHTV